MRRFIATVSLSVSAVFALALAQTPPPVAEESLRPAGANFCTDADGIIFRRGQAGFDRCLAERELEQGGEAGTEDTGTSSDAPVDTDSSGSESDLPPRQ